MTVTGGGGGGGGCTDGFEPNGDSSVATSISEGNYQSLEICANDTDWFAIDASSGQSINVSVEFSHATGDLDMTLYDSSVSQVANAQSTDDNEEISVEAGASGTYYLKVSGYNGALAPYSLVLDRQ